MLMDTDGLRRQQDRASQGRAGGGTPAPQSPRMRPLRTIGGKLTLAP